MNALPRRPLLQALALLLVLFDAIGASTVAFASGGTYPGVPAVSCSASDSWSVPFTATPQVINYTGTLNLNYSYTTGNWVFNGFPPDNLVLIWNGSNGPGSGGHFVISSSSYSWSPPSGLPIGSEIEIIVKDQCTVGSPGPIGLTTSPITDMSNFIPLVFGAYGRFMGGTEFFVIAFMLAAMAGIYAKTRSSGIIVILLLIILPVVAAFVPNEARSLLYVVMLLGATGIIYQIYRRSSVT